MGINTLTKRKLLAASGGFCGKPDCHDDLFPFFETGKITNIDELAHIIGQKENGPRGKDSLPISERDEFENIILLCPKCHTIIDKNPSLFPPSTILEWKSNHQESINRIFKIPILSTRSEARAFINPLLAENKLVFDTYGPYSMNATKDQFATELMWEKLAIQKILPNNRKIEQFIEQNQHLLYKEEFAVFIEFKLHREGFEFNKISGDVSAIVPTFPPDFANIFTDENK